MRAFGRLCPPARRTIVALVVILALAVSVRWARAAEATADTTDPRAIELSREGMDLYRQRDYAGAITRFRASYELSHAPLLLFDLGQAYRLSGDCASAAAAYREYLAVAPDAPQRQKIDGWLAGMSDCLTAVQARAAAPTPAPDGPTDAGPPSPRPDESPAQPAVVIKQPAPSALALRQPEPSPPAGLPIYKRWWFWTAAAVVAGAAGFAAFEASRRVQRPDCPSDRFCN
jgi:tetratricopeptide (TPR) repeat protein